jgi:hypothetical protein
MVIIKVLNILFIVNSIYNRAKDTRDRNSEYFRESGNTKSKE